MREFVYFIRPVGKAGPIKIGFSTMPGERLRTLMEWSTNPLEIMATAYGSYGQEQALHRMFAQHRSHLEWFEPCAELLELIGAVKAGAKLADVITVPYTSKRRLGIGGDRDADVCQTRDHYRDAIGRVFVALSQDLGAEVYPPREVSTLLNNWPKHPTPAQIEMLDAVLAHPSDHAKTAGEIWPLSVSARAA